MQNEKEGKPVSSKPVEVKFQTKSGGQVSFKGFETSSEAKKEWALYEMIEYLEERVKEDGKNKNYELFILCLCYEARSLESGINKIFKMLKENLK